MNCAFHACAKGGPRVAESGRLEVVARNARENFTQTEAHVSTTVSHVVFDRTRQLTEAALARLLEDPEGALAMGERGVRALASQRGATERTLQVLERFLLHPSRVAARGPSG